MNNLQHELSTSPDERRGSRLAAILGKVGLGRFVHRSVDQGQAPMAVIEAPAIMSESVPSALRGATTDELSQMPGAEHKPWAAVDADRWPQPQDPQTPHHPVQPR